MIGTKLWITAAFAGGLAASALLHHHISDLAVPADVVTQPMLTLASAQRVIDAALAEARGKAGTAVVSVVDAGGHLLALERLDGTFPAGAEVCIGKARTAALFQKPTRVFEEIVNKGRTAMVTIDGFTPLQGGVPLVVGGRIVGAVGVSGAASAAQDEEIAVAAAAALAAQKLPAMSVQQFPAAQVEAAFQAGAVLFDGKGTNYQIHASFRDRAGQAEIHESETDILHVLEGKAVLVTGGVAKGAHKTGEAELRGDLIEGGEPRELSPGDVVVIPAGTPHWFKEVSSPIRYYVVKVRS